MHRIAILLSALVVLTAAVGSVLPPATAQAAPAGHLVRIETIDTRQQMLIVYSPAMDREIPVRVILPSDTSRPRPTLYLLNGYTGGEEPGNWHDRTDVVAFFADKNVNVVTPIGGRASYYTDWRSDDPVLGRNKWSTFLTRELPPLVDAALGTSGRNAIAGVSASATSVLNLAVESPGLYGAVGSYSGCPSTSDPVSRRFVEMVVEDRGRGDVTNMWGPVGDPAWAAHDPYLNAERLRGIELYISSGTGLPGYDDTLDGREVAGDPLVLVRQAGTGGVIEAATGECTRRFAARLDELGIPAHVELRPTGTHSWTYWQDDLHRSWPVFDQALR
nr:alpha/beta hydrolase family protein [Rhodococcus zopfii]